MIYGSVGVWSGDVGSAYEEYLLSLEDEENE